MVVRKILTKGFSFHILYVHVPLTIASLSGGWVPETSWSFHYWQPAPRWRLQQWLEKPDKPDMSPHTPKKTGTRHTDKQWKLEGGGREKTAKRSTQNALSSGHTDE